MPIRDATQPVDLDALEPSGTDERVDLVSTDLENLGDLFDGIDLQNHLFVVRSHAFDPRLHGLTNRESVQES